MTNPISPDDPICSDCRHIQSLTNKKNVFCPVHFEELVVEAKADDSQDELSNPNFREKLANAVYSVYGNWGNALGMADQLVKIVEADYLPKSQALLRKDVEAELDRIRESLPYGDDEAVDLQFGTFDQIKASAIAIQDNGKIMAVKEIRTNLGLATPEKEEKQ